MELTCIHGTGKIYLAFELEKSGEGPYINFSLPCQVLHIYQVSSNT